MSREINLVSYLPEFMQQYKEPVATLDAENPEFVLLWKNAEKILYNRFISTADEYGISRFESLLGIYPARTDSIEVRRQRVLLRWYNKLPYTIRVFLLRLGQICGDSVFTVKRKFDKEYEIDITTHLEKSGLVDEVNKLIEEMIPCNMLIVSINKVLCKPNQNIYLAGAVGFVEYIEISD